MFARLASPLGAVALAAIASSMPLACKQREENERARQRIWGRDEPPSELQKRAKENIDANDLDRSDVTLHRVLEMPFREAVARLGFIEHRSTAELDIGVEPRKLGFFEETLLEHGLHGTLHLLQTGRNKTPLRELYYSGGVIFVSNDGGKLRAQGIAAIDKQHEKLCEEAFEPLRTFTAFYGKRLAVVREGEASSNGRPAVKYSFALRKGDELVKYGNDTPKRPKKIVGTLLVDDATGVPLEGKLSGELEVPNPKKPDSAPGIITLSYSFTTKVVEGQELTPKEYVPAIDRHPTDLDPLAFLEGRARTSTVIGGPRPAPPAEDEDEDVIPTAPPEGPGEPPDAGVSPSKPEKAGPAKQPKKPAKKTKPDR